MAHHERIISNQTTTHMQHAASTTSWLIEYLRPWKLCSLAIGIALLIAGSFYYSALDWDIPISFIMAILTYLAAAWSLRVVLERRWQLFPTALFAT